MNNRDVTNHCSKVKDKNKNDEDIVYYVAEVGNEKAGYAKVYVALKQTNDSSLIVYPLLTQAHNRKVNDLFSLIKMGLADMSYLNNITDIYSVDINIPHIFEKIEN